VEKPSTRGQKSGWWKKNLIGRKQKWRKECHYHLIFRLLGDIFTLGIRISAFFNLILSHLHIYVNSLYSRSFHTARLIMILKIGIRSKPKHTSRANRDIKSINQLFSICVARRETERGRKTNLKNKKLKN
jgi:hypothetical protein